MHNKSPKSISNFCDDVNVYTEFILDDFREFIDHHLNDTPEIIKGFILMEVAKEVYVMNMINGHVMYKKALEEGANADIKELLEIYKTRFDEDIAEMYDAYLKREIN